MNVHAVPTPTYAVWVSYDEPDHGDEAGLHKFNTEAERTAFANGIEYAGDAVNWWYGDPADPYFYCEDCGDWYVAKDHDAFEETHPWDEH